MRAVHDEIFPKLCSVSDCISSTAASVSSEPLQDTLLINNFNLHVEGCERVLVSCLVFMSVIGDCDVAVVVRCEHSDQEYALRVVLPDVEKEYLRFYCHFPTNSTQQRFSLIGVTTTRHLIKVDLTDADFARIAVRSDISDLQPQDINVQTRQSQCV